MSEEDDKGEGAKTVAKDVFIDDNVPTPVRVSQAITQIKPTVAGITVTTGGLRLNTTPTSAAASIINSIRIGTSGRNIVINQQPLTTKPIASVRVRQDDEDDGPPVLQPQVAAAAAAASVTSQQQAPILAIPQPKPNTVVLVKTPDGRTLLISNKPQTPGGPCVITYQYVQLPLTSQQPASAASAAQQSTTTTSQQSTPQQQQQRVETQNRLQVTPVTNRQPSLIRSATAAPSVMNDHVYRGSHSPLPPASGHQQQQQQNLYGNRSQGAVSGSGPGRWISVQPASQRRQVQQPPQPVQRQSSWYQDDYYDEGDDDGVDQDSPYFDHVGDYGAGGGAGGGTTGGAGGEYFMDEDEEPGGGSLYLRGGNDGPPELEPMGSVPFLRASSGYGGQVYRRVRPSGGVQGTYVSGRMPSGIVVGGSQSTTLALNRRTMELREKVDRRRLQECKAVLNRVIDEVVETERQRKREEAKNRPKKSRTEYWRQYRLKRKFKRMQDDELNKRADLWCREINKRRENIRSMVNREIQRHITESAVSKVVNERVRLGWSMPSRPLKRAPPVIDQSSLSSYVVLSTPSKRSRYDASAIASGGGVNLDYVVGSSSAAASSAFPFSSGAGLYEVGGVIYGEPSVVEESMVEGVDAYYKQDAQQQHEEDQRAAEAIMGLAAAGAAASSTTGGQQQQLAFEQQLHCICRTPLDRSKFYVMCDLCGRWFHGKCVGITEKKSRQMSTWSCRDCQKEKERATQELYCICRTPYDESQPYICCDACDGWYHCHCVGVSPAEADTLPSFLCPNCVQASGGGGAVASNVTMMAEADIGGVQDPNSSASEIVSPLSAIIKRLDAEDYNHLLLLVRTLTEHQMSWPFRRSVDPKKTPAYFELIKEPIDLSMVETRVKRRSYATLSEFARDVATIFNNARAFYASDSPEFQCANVLDQYFTKELHDVKVAIAASVAEQQQQQQVLQQ